MRDPHVTQLIYAIVPNEGFSFRDPPPTSLVRASFRGVTSGGKLVVEPSVHFESSEAARADIEPHLRAWELYAALDGKPQLRFMYESAKMIDRSPGGDRALHAEMGDVLILGDSVSFHVTAAAYPQPPEHFSYSPDVEALWNRYQAFRDGREPLLAMAYFCLSLIEGRCGSRRNAASVLQISPTMLNRLGELTSTRGDARTARKFGRQSTGTPLSASEAQWIEQAVRSLIRHIGTIDGGGDPAILTM
jgi:hypothetical protein